MNRRQFLSAAGPLAAAGAVCSSMAVPEQPTELKPGQVWVRGDYVFVVEEHTSTVCGRWGLLYGNGRVTTMALNPDSILSNWTYRRMIQDLIR